jgi:hypothetical protein
MVTESKESPFLTPAQCLAEYFPGQMGRNKFYEALKTGQIPGVTRIGDRIYISRKAMKELADGRKSG